MKLINKEWKLFGKIHLFDLVVVVLFISVAFGIMVKFSGGTGALFTEGPEMKKSIITLETLPYKEEILQNIKIGEVLSDNKTFLDGKVISFTIVDEKTALVDNHGDLITASDPIMKKAIIQVEATVEYKQPIYRFGDDEIRVGGVIYMETTTCKLSSLITDFQIVEN